MSDLVFVDTNVFVYARDARDALKQTVAEDWLRMLWAEQRGRTSIQVLSEYYATVTRKLDPGLGADQAWDDVAALLAWEPQEIDRDVIAVAHDLGRRHALSWWDSMIIAAAQLQDCAVLLSEDLQDGMSCGAVTIRNPFRHRIEEIRARYRVPAKPISRHRGRGRPRRSGRAA